MSVRKVAIISSNPTFLRFFELECKLLGYPTHCFSKMPSHSEGYSHIFVDTATVRHYGSDRPSVITVSANTNTKEGIRHLTWPVTMQEIREIFENVPTTVTKNMPSTKAEDVLWIQSREHREISYGGQIVLLSQGEMLLLGALAEAQQKPVSRETLMRLFSADTGNIVDVYVCFLRKKLEQLCERRVILTVRGVGYRLTLTVRDAEKE